ncbi:MAG: hypothetical protein ABSE27_06100 [Acidobacteriaceae bacterium]
MRDFHSKLIPTVAAAALFFSVQISGQDTQAQTAPIPASPQAVCAYLVGRMTTLLPQQPTLCSGRQDHSTSYSINIFSPKNVLEGDTRRAWSSALFQTLEELVEDSSLRGACSTAPICNATISDAYMAQYNLRYSVLLEKYLSDMQRGKPNIPGMDEFSDSWYVNWWRLLLRSKESGSAGSKENAAQIGKYACGDYIKALTKISSEIPSCSVMVATDSSLYLALDFANVMDAILAANEYELPPTIGRILDNTGYDGQVVIRSTWINDSDGPRRIYYIYPIRAISFAFEEKESGLRNDFEVGDLLRRFSVSGQMSENSFLFGDDPTEKSVLRDAAVVKSAPGPDGTILVDTTDGAEWKVSKESFDHCNLGSGDEIEVDTYVSSGNTARFDGPPTLTTQKGSVHCKLTATFIKGW